VAKQSILIVDADPRSLRILEVALRKAGFVVTTAADGPEAQRRIQRSPPDLVLCEMSLPGQDGGALCTAVRGDERLAALPFLIMSADRSPALRARAQEAGADDFLAKPLLIKELVARVRVLLAQREQARYAQRGAPAALAGSVSDLGLVDLFTSLENWQKSATVVCEGEGTVARVWVRDGQVLDAEVDPLSGEAAFYRLLNWDSGSFRVEFGPVDRESRTESSTQALLMEGMRRIDEIGRMAEVLPLTTVLSVDFTELAQQLSDMPDELNGVLRMFDGQRTLREALSQSPLDDLSTFAVVQRLIADCVLAKAHGPQAQRRKPSLEQWLGEVSVPPAPEAAETADAPAPPAPAPAPIVTPPLVQRVQRPPSVPLHRYPPLRGMRRERLRREADEVRRAVADGKPLRLTHVVELPPTPGGSDAMPEGRRIASAAVGDAAKRFAPDLQVARLFDLGDEPPVPPPAPLATPSAVSPVLSKPLTTPPPPVLSKPLTTPPPPVPLGRLGITPAPPRLADLDPSLPPAPPEAPAASPTPAPPPPVAAAPVESTGKRRWVYVAGAGLVLALALGLVWRATQGKKPGAPPKPPAAQPEAKPPAPPPLPAPEVATANVAPAPAAAKQEPPPAEAPAVPNPEEYARALSNGEALLKKGKYRAAVAELRKATTLQPESVPALLALGDAYLEADLPANAVKPLQQAAQLDGKSARAQLLLGTAYQGLGKPRDAVKAYKRYLELEPKGEFAKDVQAIVTTLSK
jgi:DNA-binding response OmpR family regulator